MFWVAVVLGCSANAWGTWLTIKGGEDKTNESERTVTEELRGARDEVRKARDENSKVAGEFREKLQTVLNKLNAATQEYSRKITEEKIRVIRNDLTKWADEFVTSSPGMKNTLAQFKRELSEKRNEETQKQIEITGQVFPSISYAVKFVQESVRAYAKKTSGPVIIDNGELPDNFYDGKTLTIRFKSGATWLFQLACSQPADESRPPALLILFSDSIGSAGGITLTPRPIEKKLEISYNAAGPTLGLASFSKVSDLSTFETAIQESFQKVIEIQLVRAEE